MSHSYTIRQEHYFRETTRPKFTLKLSICRGSVSRQSAHIHCMPVLENVGGIVALVCMYSLAGLPLPYGWLSVEPCPTEPTKGRSLALSTSSIKLRAPTSISRLRVSPPRSMSVLQFCAAPSKTPPLPYPFWYSSTDTKTSESMLEHRGAHDFSCIAFTELYRGINYGPLP